ncbi:hypothetical protein IWZ01DRAFT_309330 [Phyllosticta capitalensis]
MWRGVGQLVTLIFEILFLALSVCRLPSLLCGFVLIDLVLLRLEAVGCLAGWLVGQGDTQCVMMMMTMLVVYPDSRGDDEKSKSTRDQLIRRETVSRRLCC